MEPGAPLAVGGPRRRPTAGCRGCARRLLEDLALLPAVQHALSIWGKEARGSTGRERWPSGGSILRGSNEIDAGRVLGCERGQVLGCERVGCWAGCWLACSPSGDTAAMRLRLYHHKDGGPGRLPRGRHRTAAGADALAGARPPRVRAGGLAADRALPGAAADLPLHGDSEDRRRHPYSAEWFVDVMAGFCASEAGPGARVGGHGIGAEIALRMVISGGFTPTRLVVMTNRLHRRGSRLAVPRDRARRAGRRRRTPAPACPLARFACARPGWHPRDLMERYGSIAIPVLLLLVAAGQDGGDRVGAGGPRPPARRAAARAAGHRLPRRLRRRGLAGA